MKLPRTDAKIHCDMSHYLEGATAMTLGAIMQKMWGNPPPTTPAIADMSQHSFKNHLKVTESTECTCYHCLRSFPPDDIIKWEDMGATALCPFCGIDSVLPYNPGPVELIDAQRYWF